LQSAGRDDLAGKVEQVSETIGDGLGFDVLSFEEKLIEVKTTVLGKFFPFYVTETEVRCSEAMAARFSLFRVFDFARSPRLYVLKGSLREVCQRRLPSWVGRPSRLCRRWRKLAARLSWISETCTRRSLSSPAKVGNL